MSATDSAKCDLAPRTSFYKVSVPKEGKAIVHSGKTVTSGEILGICGTSVKSRAGTWLENGRVIRSALLGTVTVNPKHNENEHQIEISVARPSGSALGDFVAPVIGDVVIAEVITVDILEVHCQIRSISGQILDCPIPAIMRMENIEPLNPHLVELEDHFAAKDLILARILTLDSPVQLDVAGDPKLGVIMAFSTTGSQMMPVGPHEVICPDTFRKTQKRLSTAVYPVSLPPRK